MSYRSAIDPRLSQLRPEQARAYLLDHGWRQQPFPRPQTWVFSSETLRDDAGDPVVLTAPSSVDLSDYVASVEDLVKALAAWQCGYFTEILSDMLRYPAEAPPVANGATKAEPKRPSAKAE